MDVTSERVLMFKTVEQYEQEIIDLKAENDTLKHMLRHHDISVPQFKTDRQDLLNILASRITNAV